MTRDAIEPKLPEVHIDVCEPGRRSRQGCVRLGLGREVTFSTKGLEAYAFASWEPVVHDAMVVVAAVEYADRILRRPSQIWSRRFWLRIPVHDQAHWNEDLVSMALADALNFLTFDDWRLDFVQRKETAPSPPQDYLHLPRKTEAVLAYSDGMDSRAVAGIEGAKRGDKLIRVRVGSKRWDSQSGDTRREPFTTVPYNVPANMNNREASSRSRGFKFALISGLAAHLTDAPEIIVPESGQGAIGPALMAVGHAYPDYRNHPLFTARMERFVKALLGRDVRYVFPRIWNTKGETLSEFVSLPGPGNWATTRSCWRNNRWSSVNGRRRQCGVCAACLLRRMSVHAAGLTEPDDTYVCTDLGATSLEGGIAPQFTRFTPAFREYALAGVLHMDHLADMADADSAPAVRRHARALAPVIGIPAEDAERRLATLLNHHAGEWKDYMVSLGANSFIKQWARCVR